MNSAGDADPGMHKVRAAARAHLSATHPLTQPVDDISYVSMTSLFIQIDHATYSGDLPTRPCHKAVTAVPSAGDRAAGMLRSPRNALAICRRSSPAFNFISQPNAHHLFQLRRLIFRSGLLGQPTPPQKNASSPRCSLLPGKAAVDQHRIHEVPMARKGARRMSCFPAWRAVATPPLSPGIEPIADARTHRQAYTHKLLLQNKAPDAYRDDRACERNWSSINSIP